MRIQVIFTFSFRNYHLLVLYAFILGPNTFLSIAGDRTFKVKKLIDTRAYNVASIEWLTKALGGTSVRSKLLDLGPKDMLATTPQFEQEFQKKFDKFGDSYTNAISEKDLKNILSKMDVKVSTRKCTFLNLSSFHLTSIL